jgi:tetratricopeptide (TPR) repeat protein
VRSKPAQPGLLSSILLNISAVRLQQQQHSACVQYAAAAAAVDAHSVKAHYRCALALRALQQPAAALYCCQQAAAVTATTAAASYNEISKLLSELQHECSASKVQAVNSAEALARVIAVTVCNTAHSAAEVTTETAAAVAATADATVSFDADQAAHSKAAGNAHFALGEYSAALTCYHVALSHL